MIKNIFFYLFIKLILIFSFHAYAETGNLCDKFYDSIRKNNSDLGLYYAPVYEQEYPMFGFQLNQTYDEILGKWIYSRDDNNNISIFNTNYFSNSSDKLKKDDTIISLNNIEVSQLSDSEIDNIVNENNKIEFVISTSNNDEREKIFTIEKSYFDQVADIYPAFRINSLREIDVKKLEYTVNYNLDIVWYDDRLIDLIRPLFEEEIGNIDDLINSTKIELENNFDENTLVSGWWCSLTIDEFYDENLFLWHPDIKFQNIVKNELENKDTEIYFYYNIYGENYEELYIEIKENGIATFTKPKQLDFRAFPFDSHNLEFIFSDVRDGVYSIGFNLDNYSDLPLDEKLRAKIYEWNIPGELGKVSSYDHYDVYEYQYDGLNYSFVIERNSVYYIWKILAPILLLLILSWSVFWLKIEHLESRLTVTIVSLLAVIAYNNIVDKNIPKLPYLTIMDQIILSSFVFATIPTILSILYSNYFSNINSRITKSQKYVRVIGPILYLLTLFAILFSNINENPSAVATMKNYFG